MTLQSEVIFEKKKKTSSKLITPALILIFKKCIHYTATTYYWTGLLILDHSCLVGNLKNSKIAETKTL
jgi:hypothetical protein